MLDGQNQVVADEAEVGDELRSTPDRGRSRRVRKIQPRLISSVCGGVRVPLMGAL